MLDRLTDSLLEQRNRIELIKRTRKLTKEEADRQKEIDLLLIRLHTPKK